MRAKDVLLEAIAAFSGTVIFVSHDRYFIDRLATRVLEVENGTVFSYEGNYEDYMRKKEMLAASVGPPANIGSPILRHPSEGWESKTHLLQRNQHQQEQRLSSRAALTATALALAA